jgi:hypothetical protein
MMPPEVSDRLVPICPLGRISPADVATAEA